MAEYDNTSFESMFAAVQQLPPTWGPRREQPEWDRDFTGNADIKVQFSGRTEAARSWMAFALGFSSTLLNGFESKEELMTFGKDMRAVVAKGKNQFKD